MHVFIAVKEAIRKLTALIGGFKRRIERQGQAKEAKRAWHRTVIVMVKAWIGHLVTHLLYNVDTMAPRNRIRRGKRATRALEESEPAQESVPEKAPESVQAPPTQIQGAHLQI
ncbi:hypothetical protein SDJN03_06954, partial [Cucurbita argyrosperma subsp. sororia]